MTGLPNSRHANRHPLIRQVDRPCVRLRAATTKAKRADELLLHRHVANALAEAKPPFTKPTDRVFGTKPIRRNVKRDLERSEFAFEAEKGGMVDRRVLRTTFISWLGISGIKPGAQMSMARHSAQGVTLNPYQDSCRFDV